MHRMHDPIYGYIELEEIESSLIDCLLMQRLRGIHQQGTAFLTYPSSTHNRFTHSLGVMKLCSDAFDVLRRKYPSAYDPQTYECLRSLMRIVSLWHDIGYGPFSHVSERVLEQMMSSDDKEQMGKAGKSDDRLNPHEFFSYKLLKGALPKYLRLFNPEITEFLKKTNVPGLSLELFMKFLVENASSVIHRKGLLLSFSPGPGFPANPLFYHIAMKQLIHSDFDVDRLDFVQRDSYVSGSKSGHLDVASLLDNLELYSDKEGLVFSRAAWSAVETLILERYKLYRWLNFHHVVCFTDEIAARLMELGLSDGCKIFNKEEFGFDFFESLVNRDIEQLESCRRGDRPQEYVTGLMDDDYVLNKIRQAAIPSSSKEHSLIRYYLSLLEGRIIYKSLWKVVDLLNLVDRQTLSRVEAALRSDLDAGKSFINGVASQLEQEIATTLKEKPENILIAFKPYSPVQTNLSIKIIVDDATREIKDISEVSGILALLRSQRKTPRDIYEEIANVAVRHMSKTRGALDEKAKREKLLTALLDSEIVAEVPQLYTRIYVYVKGLNDIQVPENRRQVLRLLESTKTIK